MRSKLQTPVNYRSERLTSRTATSAIERSSGLSCCLEPFDERRERAALVMEVIGARAIREHRNCVRNPKIHC